MCYCLRVSFASLNQCLLFVNEFLALEIMRLCAKKENQNNCGDWGELRPGRARAARCTAYPVSLRAGLFAAPVINKKIEGGLANLLRFLQTAFDKEIFVNPFCVCFERRRELPSPLAEKHRETR
jgi:hypothetical protein